MTIEMKNLEIVDSATANGLEVHVSGRLEAEDYESFVPEIERRIAEHGKLRILVLLTDFEGWTAGGLWEDLKFDLKHFNHIERLAIVGENKWEKGMAVFCKPFTTAQVKFFEHDRLPEARRWIEEC